MSNPRHIDVSGLPNVGFDAKSPLWWGNLCLLTIETVMFAIVAAAYFYVRMNYQEWPPPRVNTVPAFYDTNPNLLYGTINTLLLLALCFAVYKLDQAARRQDQRTVNILLVLLITAGIASMGWRFVEFRGLHFLWNENAYASVIWMMLGAHLLHLLVATLETTVLATHNFRHELDRKHALDVTIVAVYWYWVAGIWVVTYGVVYFGARLL